MSDFMTSAESPAVGVGLDQITVVRIDDTHIAEERSHGGGKGKAAAAAACYEMEYSVPEEEEEEEEDSVYVIEYSNPEEEGESYQFTMSVDRSLPAKKPAPESAEAPSPTGKPLSVGQKRKRLAEEAEEEARKEHQRLVSNQRLLELGVDYPAFSPAVPEAPELVCSLCPPPGRSFQRASGLAVHMKHMHLLEANKTFFCTMCEQPVRSQVELDAHTKRHANRRAVFTCPLCPAAAAEAAEAAPGYRGSRLGLRRHLTQEHPGVVPRCDICRKGFGTLASYLADQFRHVGVSPYFCARCQIYEMTERGLTVHVRNDDKKTKKQQLQQRELQEKLQLQEKLLRESGRNGPQTLAGADNADNSATDDSDF